MEDHWNSHDSRWIENQLDAVYVYIVHDNTIACGNKMLINGLIALYRKIREDLKNGNAV